MRQTYRYVGPKEIAEQGSYGHFGFLIESVEDVGRWIRQTGQTPNATGIVIATFIIDELGRLRIADRRSEHVVCAGGWPVRSAGEIAFAVGPSGVSVNWVTNQSTGYCPEPDSWPAVEAALAQAGIAGPDAFSQEFVFRRCPRCDTINIVKEDVFECNVCTTQLPADWNLDDEGLG